MTRKILSLIAVFMAAVATQAQPMMGYTMENTTPGYEELTGGNVIDTSLEADDFDFNTTVIDGSGAYHAEAFTGQGYAIGFDFKYNSQLMNQFAVSPHGYLVLGKDQVSTTIMNENNIFTIFNTDGCDNILGVIYRGTVAQTEGTELSYKLTGEAGSRVLTVQWKNLLLQSGTWSLDDKAKVQLQIRLHEADGSIEFFFNDYKPFDGVSLNYNDQYKIGLRGTGTDRILKATNFTGNNLTTSDTGFNYRANQYPADGTSYTWTPPEDCQKPAAQPTNLTLSATSTRINGSFSKTDDADHYLVLLSKEATLTTLPTDGTYYAKNDQVGNATVIQYDTKTAFATDDNLDGATPYYIYILAVNANCMFGPKYNTEEPLNASVTTKIGAPTAIAVTNTELNSMTLQVEGNGSGNDVIIAWTDQSKKNGNGTVQNAGVFGTPTGTLNVGDELPGGGTICYKGEAKGDIVVEGMTASTVAHFMAWSVEGDDNYSSTSVSTSDMTAGELPWTSDFSITALYAAPIGWTANEWTVQQNSTTKEYFIRTSNIAGDPVDGTYVNVETPAIMLSEDANRVIFDIYMEQFAVYSWSAYQLTDDVLEVQVSANGTDYTTVGTYNKEQLKFSGTDFQRLYVPFTDLAGQKVKIRLRAKIYATDVRISLRNVKVEHKDECDYPINLVSVSDMLIGDEAGIDWTPQGEEDAWELQYKLNADEEWGDAIVVREHPYRLTGLEGLTKYDVRVRARCSAASQSQWSDVLTFTSGMSVPFNLVFGDLEEAPSGWLHKSGEPGTELTETAADSRHWSWQSSMWSGNYIQYYSTQAENNDWYISPIIDLGDGSYNHSLAIKLEGLGASQATDDEMKVIVSRDGSSFNADDAVITIDHDGFPANYADSTYTALLTGFSGKVRIGLYVSSTDGRPKRFEMKEFGVQFTCPNDVENFEIADTTETTARVKWESAAEKWFVRHYEQGTETEVAYTELTTPEYEMNDLKPHTTYEVAITKQCDEGDMAKPMVFEVTTLGELCNPVENVKVTPKKYAALIEWTAEASAYNVRYRQMGTEAWEQETVADTCIMLRSLECDTEYEYAIQARCSKLESDTSEYTPVAVLKTLEETIFPPTDITITPTHKDAAVTWQTEATRTEIGYRRAEDADWKMHVVMGTTEATLKNLEASTDYVLRMRAVNVAEKDTSLWSSNVSFRTLDIPECVTPTDLSADAISDRSAQLSWKADESNLTWNLRYREANASAWEEVMELTETSYLLSDLKAQTAYIWRVQATCEEERTSQWAAQNRFSTTLPTGIDAVTIGGNSLLNILNPEGAEIERVQIFSTDGQLIADYALNTSDNAFLRLDGIHGTILVKVVGLGQSKTVKMQVK